MAGHSRPKDGVASARLCPAIHVFARQGARKTWMPGTRPGMTTYLTRYLFAFRFLAFLPRLAVFFGTFAPAALASERPIAIACLRLLTFLPDRPLLNVPVLRFFIARSTLEDAFFEYLRAMIVLPLARNQSTQAGKVPLMSDQPPRSWLPIQSP
jgi:hypothetical protein